MNKLIVILSFVSTTLMAQTTNNEQLAFDYFFKNIFRNEYPGKSNVQFSGVTENRASKFGFLKGCFDNDYDLINRIETAANCTNIIEKKISTALFSHDLKFKKANVSLKLQLNIYNDTKVDSLYYIKIDVTKNMSELNAYFFEIDRTGKIVRWCKTGVIY